METNLTPDYWQTRYLDGQTGWDLGSVSPPLKAYFDQLKTQDISILIPGGGHAYEAEYLFRKGFKNVFIADVAEAPLAAFQKRVPEFPKQQLLRQDFFKLTQNFDLIVEQTFFCAIDPALRPKYAAKCAELLIPGGKLVGLLFNTEFEKAGPPFGGSAAEYQTYFEPYFHFHTFAEAYNSIPPRAGRELFMILERK